MQRLIKGCAAGVFFGLITSIALAQPATPATPAATPATKEAPAKRITVPEGFEKVTVGEFHVICKPNERNWVKKALEAVKPPKKPEKSAILFPSEIIEKLPEARQALVNQVTTDLGVDAKAVNTMIDEKIVPELKKISSMKLPIFYLVTTNDELKKLAQDGWGEGRLYYNKVAGAVAYNNAVSIDLKKKEVDDQLLIATYDDKSTTDDRIAGMTRFVEALEAQTLERLTLMANGTVFSEFSGWIFSTIFAPMDLKPDPEKPDFKRDQVWFATGLTNVLSAKYASVVTGVDRQVYLAELINEDQTIGSIYPARLVNLISPPKSLRPDMKAIVEIQTSRKATWVVRRWLENVGDNMIVPTLKAIREAKPADGEKLVKVIAETSKWPKIAEEVKDGRP